MHAILRLGLVVLFVVAGALFVGPAPVSAAPGNGAQKYNYTYCDIDVYNNTFCYTDIGTYNDTLTPSGNYIYTGNGRSSYSVTDPFGTVFYSETSKYHYHTMNKDWVEHEFSSHSKFTYTSYGETCTGHAAYHVVGERFQFDRYIVSCT